MASSKTKGRLSGAVWHADPCKVYCDPAHQLDGKQDKPLLTGAAGRLCATMAPGQTLRAAEREGLAYDIHRYASWDAVPADMQTVITDNGVYEAHPRGYYCAMLSAWRACTDKAWRQGQETEQACQKLCDSKQHAFLASVCTTTACRDETWRTAVFGK